MISRIIQSTKILGLTIKNALLIERYSPPKKLDKPNPVSPALKPIFTVSLKSGTKTGSKRTSVVSRYRTRVHFPQSSNRVWLHRHFALTDQDQLKHQYLLCRAVSSSRTDSPRNAITAGPKKASVPLEVSVKVPMAVKWSRYLSSSS